MISNIFCRSVMLVGLGTVKSNRCEIKGTIYVMISNIFCRSVMLVGLGSFFISSTLLGSGLIPLLSSIALKKCIWF